MLKKQKYLTHIERTVSCRELAGSHTYMATCVDQLCPVGCTTVPCWLYNHALLAVQPCPVRCTFERSVRRLFQVVVIPGTNMFLGIINETCSTMQAFCPCNIVSHFLVLIDAKYIISRCIGWGEDGPRFAIFVSTIRCKIRRRQTAGEVVRGCRALSL